jgi:hypothetical protein
MHILVHIYVTCVMLNNIFVHLCRIFRNTMRGYQLVHITVMLNNMDKLVT